MLRGTHQSKIDKINFLKTHKEFGEMFNGQKQK